MVRSYIQDFLSINNISYLTTDFMPDRDDELQSLHNLYPTAYEKIYTDKYRLQNLCEISNKYTRLPCGHDDIEAQIEIGNYVHNELVARYGNPAITQQDYTTIQQYIEHYEIVGSPGDTAWH